MNLLNGYLPGYVYLSPVSIVKDCLTPLTSRSIRNYSNSQLWQQRQQQQITGNHRYTEAFLSPVKARVYTQIAPVQSQFFPFTSPPQQCAGIRDRFCAWLPHTFKTTPPLSNACSKNAFQIHICPDKNVL